MTRVPLDETVEQTDPAPDPAAVAQQRLLAEAIREALAGLRPDQQRMLQLRYGLNGSYTYTVQEIARMMQRSDHYVH
jgi:DNA-directed RNA polymerase sigma subunit (sigma70/sigma32)